MAVSNLVDSIVENGAATASADRGGREPGGAAGQNSRDARQYPSDDEILGLGVRTRGRLAPPTEEVENGDAIGASNEGADGDSSAESRTPDQNAERDALSDPEQYREIFEANPELRQDWEDAQAFREAFATPEEARSATKSLADLRTIDTLFFSERPEDHAELARLVAQLDPGSFGSLAKAMGRLATEHNQSVQAGEGEALPGNDKTAAKEAGVKREQERFLYNANSEAVKGVLAAIESQVDRLLPENAASGARKRVVGEVYRELDQALQGNDQFGKQVRSALRSGSLDARHQSAVVSLIVGRAKQALPSVAKRVLTEWTSTILASNQDRKARQRSAESRVDIAGARAAANDGARIRSSRDIDYARMSDADILNL